MVEMTEDTVVDLRDRKQVRAAVAFIVGKIRRYLSGEVDEETASQVISEAIALEGLLQAAAHWKDPA